MCKVSHFYSSTACIGDDDGDVSWYTMFTWIVSLRTCQRINKVKRSSGGSATNYFFCSHSSDLDLYSSDVDLFSTAAGVMAVQQQSCQECLYVGAFVYIIFIQKCSVITPFT